MPTVVRTVTTAASPDRVWPYLTDFRTVVEWDPNTPDCRLVAGEGGIGTRYAITSVFRGRETHLEYTVAKIVDRERFVVHGENSTVTVVEDMRFAATPGGGTEVVYRADFTVHGVARLATPFLRGKLEGIADDAERGMTARLATLDR